MSVTALHIYEQLTEATDKRAKAKIIAEASAQMEGRYPNLKDVATQGQLRETELGDRQNLVSLLSPYWWVTVKEFAVRPELVEGGTAKSNRRYVQPFMVRQARHERLNITSVTYTCWVNYTLPVA